MEKIEAGEKFVIETSDGEGQEVEVLGTLAIDGADYAAVSFSEDIEREGEGDIDVFFLKVDDEGDFTAIESDEEFAKVSAAFEEVMEEE
ncbi:DUF1292 domain-containing protein [Peribacillus sp. SCS-37]|uniref:DUF1292 domain-containing protein n=1 Tax=Paraperibacillus esterisolvens TaxID=3115296 RepID=UPI00390611D5